MDERVRIGFIGCGGIANWHMGHLENIPEAHVTAVCDLIEERARKAAERFEATPYLDYRRMLEQEELDALYVCVPPYAHDGMELLAAEKGIHLFVEKPMALSMDYARSVAQAIAERNLISAVGFQLRYADIIPRVKAWIEMHDVGLFTAHRVAGMPLVWWWRRKELSGGQVVEQTIHQFDLLRDLFGEVEQVQALNRCGMMTDVENYDTDDGSCVLLRFRNGIIGTVASGCFTTFGGEHGMTVFARDARLEFGGTSFRIREPNMTIECKAGNDHGQEEDETFVRAVLTGDPSEIRSPYADALRSLEVVLAVNESMEKGGAPVTITGE